jgi:shikimate dehydrogenase
MFERIVFTFDDMKSMFGIIGKKLSHSYSAILFEEKFGTTYPFKLFELDNISDLNQCIENNPSLLGFNVTIPYKKEIIPFLNEMDDISKLCGSVNTVTVNWKKRKIHLKGYNTDVFGFYESYKNIFPLGCKKALILGTGGAANAVSFALKQASVDTLFVSRNKGKLNTITYAELSPEIIKDYKIIINTTPLGMFPEVNDGPEICYSAIGKDHVVIDIIYNPESTVFLQKAESQYAKVYNGLNMLKKQAEKAWEIWGLTKP